MAAHKTTAWIPESTHPRLEFERVVYAQGFRRIAGVDEAGRGPLAGPIVAAAVVLAEPIEALNDSKQLTETVREELFAGLQGGDHAIGVSVIDPADIDANGIQWANYAAMARAIEALEPAADFALVDGFAIEGCDRPQSKIIKGDARSMSIAAGSIIAKVTRDRILCELDRMYPEYGFAKHKGYATRTHLDAIERWGPCPAHRMSFAPIARQAQTSELFEPAREYNV